MSEINPWQTNEDMQSDSSDEIMEDPPYPPPPHGDRPLRNLAIHGHWQVQSPSQPASLLQGQGSGSHTQAQHLGNQSQSQPASLHQGMGSFAQAQHLGNQSQPASLHQGLGSSTQAQQVVNQSQPWHMQVQERSRPPGAQHIGQGVVVQQYHCAISSSAENISSLLTTLFLSSIATMSSPTYKFMLKQLTRPPEEEDAMQGILDPSLSGARNPSPSGALNPHSHSPGTVSHEPPGTDIHQP